MEKSTNKNTKIIDITEYENDLNKKSKNNSKKINKKIVENSINLEEEKSNF